MFGHGDNLQFVWPVSRRCARVRQRQDHLGPTPTGVDAQQGAFGEIAMPQRTAQLCARNQARSPGATRSRTPILAG